MIVGFPDLYPDEAFYSGCARYADRMGFSSTLKLTSCLFGYPTAPSLALPSYLSYFESNFPTGIGYSANEIIEGHTLFPFYSHFLNDERRQSIRNSMLGNDGRLTYSLLGMPRSTPLSVNDFLRYCTSCVMEDEKIFEEPYWHRIHQLPSLYFCPVHHQPIRVSSVNVKSQGRSGRCVAAKKVDLNLSEPAQSVYNPFKKVLSKLAEEQMWLLNKTPSPLSDFEIQDKLIAELKRQDYISWGERLNGKKFSNAFFQTYSKEFLELLDPSLAESPHLLLSKLIDRSRFRFMSPLNYLLVIHFLGYSYEKFLELPNQSMPFGTGPWPCKNPYCDFFERPIIHECKIDHYWHQEGVFNRKGVFTCTKCGQVYLKLGSQNGTESDIDILEYGLIWKKKFSEVWIDPNRTMPQKANIMNVSPKELLRQAKKLKFPMQPESTQHNSKNSSYTPEIAHKSDYFKNREKYRRVLTHVIQENSEATYADLRCNLEFLQAYKWLVKNDGEWLSKNKPIDAGIIHRQGFYENRDNYRGMWKQIVEENPSISFSNLKNNSKYLRAYYWLRRYDHEWFYENKPWKTKNIEANRIRKKDKYRLVWRHAMEENLSTSIAGLVRNPEYLKAYNWLIENDREWFNENNTINGNRNRLKKDAKRGKYRYIWEQVLKENPFINYAYLSNTPEYLQAYNWLLRNDREWLSDRGPLLGKYRRSVYFEKREKYRMVLNRTKKEYPLATYGDLKYDPDYIEAYRWLQKNDRDWFDKNKPTMGKVRHDDFYQKKEKYRQVWEQAIKENPLASCSDLIKFQKYQQAYSWLRINDLEWFNLNKPKRKKVQRSWADRADWAGRDDELLQRIIDILPKLKDRLPPVYITTTLLMKELDLRPMTPYIKARMPKSVSLLDGVTETHEEFKIRYMDWVVNCYQLEGIIPSRVQFLKRIRISNLNPKNKTSEFIHLVNEKYNELIP